MVDGLPPQGEDRSRWADPLSMRTFGEALACLLTAGAGGVVGGQTWGSY